ncbi:UNVERIFIED_CONTAM: hypothetical protein HDU68_010763 [Siphonaria sp. JEL0065]|nr:hypothetical protein HDU68_010763 [Siphonaria sp. JEL0065]
MSTNGCVQESYRSYLNSITSIVDEETLETSKEMYAKLETKLQTTAFVRNGIVPLLARKLDYHWSFGQTSQEMTDTRRFVEKLDSNPKLLGFTNGVWDFEARVFRDAMPLDYISISTHNTYVPWNDIDNQIRVDLQSFIDKLFVDSSHRDYLNCSVNKNQFFIMTRAGVNGKSTLVRLLNEALGDYAGEVSVELFTARRPPASNATPELMQIKGKRIVCCSEPNAKDNLNLGTIKWVTGGDRIMARNLLQKIPPFTSKPPSFAYATTFLPSKRPNKTMEPGVVSNPFRSEAMFANSEFNDTYDTLESKKRREYQGTELAEWKIKLTEQIRKNLYMVAAQETKVSFYHLQVGARLLQLLDEFRKNDLPKR